MLYKCLPFSILVSSWIYWIGGLEASRIRAIESSYLHQLRWWSRWLSPHMFVVKNPHALLGDPDFLSTTCRVSNLSPSRVCGRCGRWTRRAELGARQKTWHVEVNLVEMSLKWGNDHQPARQNRTRSWCLGITTTKKLDVEWFWYILIAQNGELNFTQELVLFSKN